MASARYRCTGCGNLTRFDVVTDRRTRAFHHYSVGGALQVEEEQVLAEDVVSVSCRWCGHGRSVEVLSDSTPAPESSTADTASHPSATLSSPSGDRDPGNR